MNVKEFIKLLTPPVFIRLARLLLVNREFIYIPKGWAYAKTHSEVKGWNVQDVLKVYKRK